MDLRLLASCPKEREGRCPGLLWWAQIILKVSGWERQELPVSKWCDVIEMWLALLREGGKKPRIVGGPKKLEEQGDRYFSRASRENSDLLHLCLLVQWNLGQTLAPQDCTIMHSHCFKPLNLCYLVSTAIGNFTLRAVSGLKAKYKIDPPFPLCRMTFPLLGMQNGARKTLPDLLSYFLSPPFPLLCSVHVLPLSLSPFP